MAEHSSFFNGPTYDAADFAAFFASFFKNGVFAKPADGLQARALHNDMRVTILPGVAFIDGYRYELDNSDAEFTLTVPTADGTLDRKDIVVIRRDLVNNNAKAYYVAGTPASNPSVPALTHTSEIDEIQLCSINVVHGAVKISDSDITDTRFYDSVCGIVASLVKDISASELFAQYNSLFSVWFAGVQDTLDGDAAGNLLNMINAITNSKGQPNGIGGLNGNGALPPEQGGTGQNSLSAFRNAAGLGNTAGPLPIKNGGTEASTAIDAIKNLGLSPEVISTGDHYILLKAGSIINLRIYGASANAIPTIPEQYRPHTVDATGFAWILGSSPQAGLLDESGYNGNVGSYVMSGPNASDTECRGSVMWIAN